MPNHVVEILTKRGQSSDKLATFLPYAWMVNEDVTFRGTREVFQ